MGALERFYDRIPPIRIVEFTRGFRTGRLRGEWWRIIWTRLGHGLNMRGRRQAPNKITRETCI